jgi:predicted chitinase
MMMSLRKNDVGEKSNKKPNTILFQIEKQWKFQKGQTQNKSVSFFKQVGRENHFFDVLGENSKNWTMKSLTPHKTEKLIRRSIRGRFKMRIYLE